MPAPFDRPASVPAFALFALLPGLLLAAACLFGGPWIWAALIWMGGASQIVDTVIARGFADPGRDEAPPGTDLLSVLLALLHFLLLAGGLAALLQPDLGMASRIALFLGLGLFFGQVSNSNAHELIHRGSRALFRLGAAVYVGLGWYLGLCLYAQMQMMLADYVQHYGLERARRADGRYEPVGPRHSWDAPHFLSSLMMVNAPRHSDHHAHPGRAYPALRLERAGKSRPMLPWSLPVMAALAMWPRIWRRVMDRRVMRMRG